MELDKSWVSSAFSYTGFTNDAELCATAALLLSVSGKAFGIPSSSRCAFTCVVHFITGMLP